MGTTAQVKAEVHQRRGQERRPFRQRGLLIGSCRAAPGLYCQCRVIVAFDLSVEQVRRCSKDAPAAEKKNKDPLPKRHRFHGSGLSLLPVRSCSGPEIVCLTTLTFTPSAIPTSTLPSSCTLETLPMIPPEVMTVPAAQSLDHSAVFLHLLLLRADQQEVEDDEDQDDRHQTANGGSTRRGGPGGLGESGGDEHGLALLRVQGGPDRQPLRFAG